MSTGAELAFFYIFGILAAVELDYINHALVDVLADTRIGLLGNAESEPAEFFVKELHSLHEPACGCAGSCAAA